MLSCCSLGLRFDFGFISVVGLFLRVVFCLGLVGWVWAFIF